MDTATQDVGLIGSEFNSAVGLLRELIPAEELEQLQPSGPATIYTSMVTIWMMVLQRLGAGKSQAKVVKEVLSHSRDLLPDNKRVREGTISENSSAFNAASKRISLETMEFFASRVCDSLIDSIKPSYGNRRRFIIDGTTITLEPTDELKAAFPPATNQHGESDWPVAMLLVAHELESGCAIPPEIGPMYGENNTSEAKLARQIAERLPPHSIVYADSGFGIFSVAYHVTKAELEILFRLTKSRFKSLVKKATLVAEADGVRTYQLCWTPTAKDRKSNPELPEDAHVHVTLHSVPLDNGDDLYLVTTLRVTGAQAADMYSDRYDVEHDIRDVKITLDTENIRARSVEMLKKELLSSFVAYNLVVEFRREAARLANVSPRRLSFKGVLDTFESYLLHHPACSGIEWHQQFVLALTVASRDKLPNRPGRSYPRRALPRRPKSTKFMKQQRKADSADKVETEPPPLVPK